VRETQGRLTIFQIKKLKAWAKMSIFSFRLKVLTELSCVWNWW